MYISFDIGVLSIERALQRVPSIDKEANRKYMIIEQSPKSSNSIRSVSILKVFYLK